MQAESSPFTKHIPMLQCSCCLTPCSWTIFPCNLELPARRVCLESRLQDFFAIDFWNYTKAKQNIHKILMNSIVWVYGTHLIVWHWLLSEVGKQTWNKDSLTGIVNLLMLHLQILIRHGSAKMPRLWNTTQFIKIEYNLEVLWCTMLQKQKSPKSYWFSNECHRCMIPDRFLMP